MAKRKRNSSGLRVKARGNRLYIMGSLLGMEVRRTTGLPVHCMDEAEAMRIKIEQEIIGQTYGIVRRDHTFNDAAESYKSWRQLEGNLTTDLERRVGAFVRHWGHRSLEGINKAEIAAWSAKTYRGLKPGTIRRNLNIFRAILNHAAEHDMVAKAPKVPMPFVDDERDEHFELGEIEMFLGWIKSHNRHAYLYPIFVCLIDAGLRLGEAIRLQWRDVRLEERTLSVKTHRRKANEGRTKSNNRDVPMSQRLTIALAATPLRDRYGYVFRKPDGTSWLDFQPNRASKALNKALKQACAHMGIEPLRVHDLRHTFAYQATMHGADLGDLQQLLGHSDISQTMRYRGWIASRARAVVENFGPSL